jgi:hypothetical protein
MKRTGVIFSWGKGGYGFVRSAGDGLSRTFFLSKTESYRANLWLMRSVRSKLTSGHIEAQLNQS